MQYVAAEEELEFVKDDRISVSWPISDDEVDSLIERIVRLNGEDPVEAQMRATLLIVLMFGGLSRTSSMIQVEWQEDYPDNSLTKIVDICEGARCAADGESRCSKRRALVHEFFKGLGTRGEPLKELNIFWGGQSSIAVFDIADPMSGVLYASRLYGFYQALSVRGAFSDAQKKVLEPFFEKIKRVCVEFADNAEECRVRFQNNCQIHGPNAVERLSSKDMNAYARLICYIAGINKIK